MVQQQFIISELAGADNKIDILGNKYNDLLKNNNPKHSAGGIGVVQKDMHIKEQNQSNQENLQNQSKQQIVSQLQSLKNSHASFKDLNIDKQKEKSNLSKKQSNYSKNQSKISKQLNSRADNEPFTRVNKACFGVFGSVSHTFILNHSELSDKFLAHSQSAFRILALNRPNEQQVLLMVLKAEGFQNYQEISELVHLFLEQFYDIKEKLQLSDKKKLASKEQRESVNDQITMRDLKSAIKISNILKEQEIKTYFNKLKAIERRNQKLDIIVMQKTKDEKMLDMEQEDMKLKVQEEERYKIEINCIKEGLRFIFKQKFFNQWRDIQLAMNSTLDQYQVSQSLEKSIVESLEKALIKYQHLAKERQLQKERKMSNISDIEEIQANQQRLEKQPDKLEVQPLLGLMRKGTISSTDVQKRFSANSGVSALEHNIERQIEEKKFLDLITMKIREAIQELKLEKINAQLRNCINVIEYLRRVKGIALVGPVCTGKTQILKIVSKVLQMSFGIQMRTSVVNSAILSYKELYGATDAFQKKDDSIGLSKFETDNQVISYSLIQQTFGQQSIFEIILDVFEKEKNRQDKASSELILQSIFFDSTEIESSMSESLLAFLRQANYRESETNCEQEFLIGLAESGKLRQGVVEKIPVTFPNCNILMFPSDLCLFFEAQSLKNASPLFIQQIGIILTEQDDLDWNHIYQRNIKLFLERHCSFFDEAQLDKKIVKEHFDDLYKEFLEPFVDKLMKNPKLQQWQHWNVKSSVTQFFTLLNSSFYKLSDVLKSKKEEGEYHQGFDSSEFPLQECLKDVIYSNYLMCTVWSFGGCLSKELRKVLEEQFLNFRRKFNVNLGGAVGDKGGLSQTGTGGLIGRTRFTLFDIYFDSDRLQWDLLQEKLEYKLKLHFDPLHNMLLIPTVEIAQAYFLADYLFSGIKHEDENDFGGNATGAGSALNKHLRILGPCATSKTVILNTFAKRSSDQYVTLNIPMSSYLTFDKLKSAIESLYVSRRRNLLEPKDKDKKIILLIDDLHLHNNLNINVLEFLRTWCISKGYYDVKKGFFKNIGDFGTLMAENSEYRRESYCKVQGKEPLQSQSNRFLFYGNMLYQDEYDSERFKVFIQHFLTSKMWNTSKIVNKYYILITNSLMTIVEKLKRQDIFHQSSFLRLNSMHLFARFCANLANYTLISDDPSEYEPPSFKKSSQISQDPTAPSSHREEDAAADMMAYELQRTIGDRIMMPQHRIQFLNKVAECCKIEFLSGNHMTASYLDGLLLGNYHNRRPGAHIKYMNYNKEQVELRNVLREKLKNVSSNHFLESFLDAPNGLKEIFRLSRILFKEMQHLLLVGMHGSGKHEYLQLAALLNDALMFEINASKFGEPLQFAAAFKDSLLSAISLNTLSFIVINDQQLRDATYIDYIYNFIMNICNNEKCVLMEPLFREQIIKQEKDQYLKINQENPAMRMPNDDILFLQALRKIQKNVHIVLLVSEFQTYFEWVSLFPGLESKLEVIYFEELSNEGYVQLSQNFFQARDIDNGLLQEAKLSKCLVDTAKGTIKNRLFSTFYTAPMLQHMVSEPFVNYQLGEYILSRLDQVHTSLYNNSNGNGGGYQVQDPLNKQITYSLGGVDIVMTYKARYVMFVELFRFLYDFLSLNLVIRRNYYETFLRKSQEFSDFFKDIKSTKSTLHSESNTVNFKLVSLRDKILKITQLIADKEATIIRRQKDIKDLEVDLKNNKQELNQVIQEKDAMLNQILEHFENISGSEFNYVIKLKHSSNGHKDIKEHEKDILNILSVIIERDSTKNMGTCDLDIYFLNRSELIAFLNECRNFDYNNYCFAKLKEFITKYTVTDFKDKQLLKGLFQYLMELYRKLNVRNTMSNTYNKLKEIKEMIDSNFFSITYSQQFIADKREELADFKQKHEFIANQEQHLSKRIEEAEISHMRTEHIFQNIEKYSKKIKGKLESIDKRLENLLGDCIIMAASVSYLGVFFMQDRLLIRRELAENILNTWRLKCSPIWMDFTGSLGSSQDKNRNRSNGASSGSKMFKQVLKEYGLRKILLPYSYSEIISEGVLVETLFAMVFAPTCPLIVDPTGEVQEFIMTHLLSQLQIKSIYASDSNINFKLEQILRSSSFVVLNDLNDCSKDTFGLSSQDPILHRLASSLNNGFDFDYEKLAQLKDLRTLGSFFNSFSGVNKRIPTNLPEFENLSFYQVQLITSRLEFTLSKDYMSKLTMTVAMDNDSTILANDINPFQQQQNKQVSGAWLEVKELMIKYFLPEEFSKLEHIRNKIKQLNERSTELNKRFENAFLVANQDTLQNMQEYSLLKQSVEDIKYAQEEKASYSKSLSNLLNDHPLLTQYSNIILLMFLSLKQLSKLVGEVTYSWKMFLNIFDSILQKIVRELNSDILGAKPAGEALKNKEDTLVSTRKMLMYENQLMSASSRSNQGQSNNNKSGVTLRTSRGAAYMSNRPGQNIPKVEEKEFTIDEEFFSQVILPALHSTLISGIKQHSVALFNLILTVKLQIKNKQITESEGEYFFKQLLSLQNFQKWRETEHEFIDLDEKIEKNKFFLIKREIIRIYPEIGRKVMDLVEKELGQSFVYKKASIFLFGKFFNTLKEQNMALTLMQKINIGFLCPDHEFKSKLCQLVYEQLSAVFQFNEEYIKLHHFIKTASWSYPIALFTSNSINIINTVCSIASYYGVGLEVLRTEVPQTGGGAGYLEKMLKKKDDAEEANQNIKNQLNNYNYNSDQPKVVSSYQRLFKEAVIYGGRDLLENNNKNFQQINYEQSKQKEALEIEDKLQQSLNSEQNPLKTIETCAIQGSWVFISTIKFPSFWSKMCALLTSLRSQNKISNTFRVFVDLQGFTQNEIPDSFLFDFSVSYYLTNQNNEDMEGFNDIWANILNDKILTDISQLKEKKMQDESKKQRDIENIDIEFEQDKAEQQMKIIQEEIQNKNIMNWSQINIDNSIKNEKQRQLYKDFIRNEKDNEQNNISNTLIFGSNLTEDFDKANQERKSQTQSSMMYDSMHKESKHENTQYQVNKPSTLDLVQRQESQVYQQQDRKEEVKISRINSINQSAEISRGENTLIQELEAQMNQEDMKINNVRDSKKAKTQASIQSSKVSEKKSIGKPDSIKSQGKQSDLQNN